MVQLAMRSRSLLFLPFILLVGLVVFEAGRRVGARTAASIPEAPMHASAGARAPAPVRATTCEKELAETKLKLGLCLAYGSPRTTPSAGATQNPLALLGRRIEGVRLDRALTTEMIDPTDDKVVVQRPDGTVRIYSPGQWPPPGGPGVGSKILRRTRADGTVEMSSPDGFPEPEGPTSMPGEVEPERLGRLMRETPGAFLVRRADGSLHVYGPNEWPPPGGPEPGASVLQRSRGDAGNVSPLEDNAN
jgi:hypothetical protein